MYDILPFHVFYFLPFCYMHRILPFSDFCYETGKEREHTAIFVRGTLYILHSILPFPCSEWYNSYSILIILPASCSKLYVQYNPLHISILYYCTQTPLYTPPAKHVTRHNIYHSLLFPSLLPSLFTVFCHSSSLQEEICRFPGDSDRKVEKTPTERYYQRIIPVI